MVLQLNLHKKILPLCLILFLLFQSFVSAASETRPITVNVNGEFVATDSNPFIQSGRILIPIRSLASFGLTYSWDSKSHTATITNSAEDTFKMIQGQPTAYKNGQPLQMDSEANNYNGRLMVPAKFVSDAFGYHVYYERTRGILFIQTENYTPDLNKLSSTNLQEARLAAISLPIDHYSFKINNGSDREKLQNYSYSFAANDALHYAYMTNVDTTVVEIKNGEAYAIWQYNNVDIPGNEITSLGGHKFEYISDMFHDSFSYLNGNYTSYYRLVDGSIQTMRYQAKTYGDIIQAVPL